MHTIRSIIRKPLVIFILGLLVGALIVLGIRFATYSPQHTHYHANFAVYINGERETFNNPAYYEEITACQTNGAIQPEQRAHMHDNINSVVHVHDDGVTWGQFFENLGWYVGPDFIQKRDGTLLKASGDETLHVYVNGEDYTGLEAIARQVIGDKDRLLLSFGNVDEATLKQEYQNVAQTAAKYNTSKDPASCSGGHEHVTFSERLKSIW